MDARVRTFVAEAERRFEFLLYAGFSGPSVARSDGYPTVLKLTYDSPYAEVEVRLILASMGEEHVSTTLSTSTGRDEFGPTAAQTAYQMRRALNQQAEAARSALW